MYTRIGTAAMQAAQQNILQAYTTDTYGTRENQDIITPSDRISPVYENMPVFCRKNFRSNEIRL